MAPSPRVTRSTRSKTNLVANIEVENNEPKKLSKKRIKKETEPENSVQQPKKIKLELKKEIDNDSEIKKEDENIDSKLQNGKANGTKSKAQEKAIKKEVDDSEPEDEPIAQNSKTKKNSKASAKKTVTKSKKKSKNEDDDDKPIAQSSKAKKNGKAPEKKTAIVRSLVKKGAAAVDGLCPIVNASHVYCEDDDVWDCLLNQTNIQFNNNKYYIIQLLKDDDVNAYSIWMRWGRVGLNGQNCLKPFGSNLEKAKTTFKQKFCDKTKNDWETRDCFEKVPGKYDLLQMDYSDDKDTVDSIPKEEESKVPKKKVESKLEAGVKLLIELICNVKAMEEAVVEMKYDAQKAPLGKLTDSQVKAGYAALKHIDDVISGSGKTSNKDLLQACNDFYTRIPHYFGMKVPPMIRTKAEVQEKLSLLQALGDIQAAMSILNKPIGDNIHPADQHYNGLNCDIHLLENSTAEYKLLENYLTSTHGSTHSMYKMHLESIYKVSKDAECSRFNDVGNRMLLWHGSRLTNWAGILSQGLRIAPPEAPVTGYMFGKGIYFADMSSKSANYCMPSMVHDTGLLVLCDVALGKSNELVNSDYKADRLPKGCHSVKGLGRTVPKDFTQNLGGSLVPMGPGVNAPVKKNLTLQYNEYIVYDVSQVQIKYLLKIKFTF